MALINYAWHNKVKNHDILLGIFENHALWFDNVEEMSEFLKALTPKKNRFGVYSKESETVFDLLVDSDVIYCDFVKNYPQKVKNFEDLQNMSWWEFQILLTGLGTSINDRVSIRSEKPTKDREKSRAIFKAKNSIFISDTVYE